MPVIAVACAVSDASAQIVPFSDRPAWTNAASPTGQVDCDDLESSPTGSFPIPYHTGGNWLLESQGVPSAADVVAPGSINGSHQVQIRSAGPEGIHLTPPCQPCAAFGFDYQTRGAPWVVTVNGQPFNLPPGTTGFFGVTSTVPITSITLGTAQPGVLMALDNLCCAEGGVVGDPCLRDSIQLNTGVDHNTNTAYPIGVHDAWYQVVADPDSTTFEPRPAGTILKHPAWADPEPNTQWLGGYPTNQAILNGYYVYETCFCLQEGYQNVSITLGARADDEVQVFFNEPTPSQPNTFTNLVHTGDRWSTSTIRRCCTPAATASSSACKTPAPWPAASMRW